MKGIMVNEVKYYASHHNESILLFACLFILVFIFNISLIWLCITQHNCSSNIRETDYTMRKSSKTKERKRLKDYPRNTRMKFNSGIGNMIKHDRNL